MLEPEQRSSRGATSELTFIAPIRRGEVPDRSGIRHADRLRAVLEAFNARENAFAGGADVPLALRAFGGIHFAHLALVDGDSRLLFSVDFDGSMHDYLAGLSSEVPHLLHLIFSNCVGWEPVEDQPRKLVAFVESYQVKTNFWYAHAPELSVKDVEWLQSLREVVEELARNETTRECGVRLLSEATARNAPRSTKGRLAQLFKAARPDETARAKESFAKGFAKLYSEAEWRAAYEESFAGRAR